MAAYDEVESKFSQLPGQGEIITNVSIGDIDDTANPQDGCFGTASSQGPTTELVGGQHYIDWPSMPLIAAYVADSSGVVSGSNSVCDVDPALSEVGLDFSMMAPLPHNLQRTGEQGNGITDLLGIAPGAQYRLVVPADTNTTISDIDAAFIGAALQEPRPKVITASLGFGLDVAGFPSRYLEEDPITEAVIAAITQQYHIVVCISAGDGTRTFTGAAIGPSGGSAATNVLQSTSSLTSISDDTYSTIPSVVLDSGAIDVGGTTLDDIFSASPSDPYFAALASAHAFAETRYNGFMLFSSGFGTRVDVSAPSDNVISFEHQLQGSVDSVNVVLEGGTSASAPEVAAVAAVAQQVARLTGHPFTGPLALRTFLENTGTHVPAVPQADVNLNVGPQVNLRRVVETLLEPNGFREKPSVANVAIEQRRNFGSMDTSFVSYTDPTNIDLGGSEGFPDSGTNADELAWITIAPHWEFMPPNVNYRLIIAGRPGRPLATTPWARVLPASILGAAGLPLTSSGTRTVNLVYEALQGAHAVVSAPLSLTFGPAGAAVFYNFAPAPHVPPVTSGPSIPVKYDISNVSGFSLDGFSVPLTSARIVISLPGRGDMTSFTFGSGNFTYVSPSLQLGSKGTLDVPVSALQGGGLYGAAIAFNYGGQLFPAFSDIGAFRVIQPKESASRPTAPLLSSDGRTWGHFLEIPYNGSFNLSYDVRNVPAATGATLEVSAAGPSYGLGVNYLFNTFNNPNGSIRDNNGYDTGSIYFVPLGGTSGTLHVSANAVGLYPTMNHVIRVIPTTGANAAGEAGDVSTITMDGLAAADGGFIGPNFAINQSGDDGFLTSTQTAGTESSLEVFSQSTNTIQQVLQTSNAGFFTNGWGIWGTDLGLFGVVKPASGANPASAAYNLIAPVASGSIGAPWIPPYPNSALTINEAAANQANGIGAFLLNTGPPYSFFTSDIVHNTFSPAYSLMAPIQNFGSPGILGIAENLNTNTAVLPALDLSNAPCGSASPTILTVNMNSGAVSSFLGPVGNSYPTGIALDPQTNKAAIPSLVCRDVAIYDLATKSAIDVQDPPGTITGGLYTAFDPKAKEFLVYYQDPPDILTNYNALSAVLVYDENGKLLKTVERFTSPFFNWIPSNNLQINPTTRSGYTPSRFGQLTPFHY